MAPAVVVVTGSRAGADQATISAGLDAWDSISSIIHGDCPDPGRPERGESVDACAQRWAQARGVPWLAVPAPWDAFGPPGSRRRGRAGPARNARMADMLMLHRLRGRRVAVLAFPGGRGTRSMVAEALARGLMLHHADVSSGSWTPAETSPPGRRILHGAVSMRVDDALHVLRNVGRPAAVDLGALRMPPPGMVDAPASDREPLPGGAAVALHCSKYGDWDHTDPVTGEMATALHGCVFAVARLADDGRAVERLWPTPRLPVRGRPRPWRLHVVDAARIDGALARAMRAERIWSKAGSPAAPARGRVSIERPGEPAPIGAAAPAEGDERVAL